MTASTFLGVGRTILPPHPAGHSLLALLIADLSLHLHLRLLIMDRSLLVLPITDLSLRSHPIHPYHPYTLDSPLASDEAGGADVVARSTGDPTVATGIMDIITDLKDMDVIAAATVVPTRKIHTRILLARAVRM